MSSGTRLARVAGVLYLAMAVTTGIAGWARGSLVVADDPAATADHLRAAATLFRVGIFADLVSATAFLLTAMALYVLLRRVNALAAGAMVTLVAVSVAIQALNLVSEIAALSIATGAGYTTALGQAGSDALTLLFIRLQHDGFVLSQMFFALWLLPLGYLVVTSRAFPRLLGYLLAIACLGYLVDLGAYLLVPGIEGLILPISAIAGVAGELSFMAWLLVKGARFAPHGPAATSSSRDELVTAALS